MDIQELVRAQRTYFDTGVTRPYAFRLLQLKKLQQALRDNEQLLEQAMMQDFRKAPMEVYMCETGMVLEELRFHLKHLKGWMRERAVPTPLAQFPSKSFVSPEPYGVALIISPWNYPVQLCLSPLVGAISGGNCAVVKPSAYAPATSAAIAKLIRETFDARYIAAVEGGRAENSALLAQRFDTIFFTGSVAVGKVVMEAAAKHLTPVTLELGGKSPVIVDKTADLKLAARRIAFGKVLNAGQTCVEPDYLLIDTSVKDAFAREYRAALQEFFPEVNIRKLYEVEQYHQKLARILDAQFAEERTAIEREIAELRSQWEAVNAQIRALGFVGNISREFLNRHSEIKAEIAALRTQNQAYLTQTELQAAKATAVDVLKRSIEDILREIEDILNGQMKEFNDSLFTTKKKPPQVHFSAYNSYRFETPDNTGTGSNYKGMLIYDLAVLFTTALPALAHDSLLFKNLGKDAEDGIFQIYAMVASELPDRQIFIAYDKQGDCRPGTRTILEANCVMRLSKGGGELYGHPWDTEEDGNGNEL